MRNQIVKDKEFNIISRSVDNAEKCKIIDVEEDCFSVKLLNLRKYETGESVELFAMTSKGQLYFETLVKEVNGDILSVWFPISYKYLQRREFSRINIDKEIILHRKGTDINAGIYDISAGGLKVITKEQLCLLQDYETSVDIENKIINTVFVPIRTEADGNNFISSGRFKDINSYDRISLVQYCFRKQIEYSNK